MIDPLSLQMTPALTNVPLTAASSASSVVSNLLGQSDGVSYTQMGIVVAVIAILVIPFMLGGVLARALKMPTYGMRIGAILFALTSAIVVLSFGQLQWGVDLRGGTILVYELDPTALQGRNDGEGPGIQAADVIEGLTKRINPSGTQEIVIRPYGDRQVEIIVPTVNPAQVQAIKDSITQAGILRFAIVANSRDHSSLIDTASELATRGARVRRIENSNGRVLGFWADVDRQVAPEGEIAPLDVDVTGMIVRNPATGQLLNLPPSVGFGKTAELKVAEYMAAEGIDNIQVLMVLNEKLDVTGEDLSYVSQGYDQDGSPMVRFSLRDSGARLFDALTLNNQPDGTFRRQLGIVLDNALISAPTINSRIQGDGTISGNFTNEEVEFLVNILRSGQLPAALNETPISENQIGSTLGADTINKGLWAIGISLLCVLVFVFIYYQVAGLIACLALIMNVVLILALMILINQPLTLPGLAGLVLTVGMSVDANVLIFERIREEVTKGSATRLAIRNGFSKATTTIVDANLTTLITAIVLYAIGTDQIRGFAVTLILGILFSMFTAIYVSRTFFDIAERRGKMWLGMSDLVSTIRKGITGNKDIDFMSKGRIAMAFSLLFIVLGVVGIGLRGSDILDIDFAGGSSVTFQLDQPVDAEDVRALVKASLKPADGQPDPQFTLNRVDVDVEGFVPNTVYKVDADFKEAGELKDKIAAGFANSDLASLVTYQVQVEKSADLEPMEETTPTQPALPAQPASEDTGMMNTDNGVQLVSTRAQEEQDEPDSAVATESVNEAGNRVETTERIISEAIVSLSIEGKDDDALIDQSGIIGAVMAAAKEAGVPIEETSVTAVPIGEGADAFKEGSSVSFATWKLTFDLPAQAADAILAEFQEKLNSDPVWLSSSEISGQVAGQMIQRAVAAMFASLLFIIGYIWFRFQRVAFGFAAVVALIHDVLITVGAIAISYWLAGALGFLLIDPFKISLTVVAALLTIVGYSLNDTIVVFDRIREVRGKSPRLTSDMINTSINQTLSRTLLTSLTTLIVVVLLYFFGGAGIHAFAFSLVVGVVVGTYSSVFVASPILLWLVNRDTPQPTTK